MLSQESVQIAAFQEADINPMSAAGFVAAWRRHQYHAVLSPVDSQGKHRVALASCLPLRQVQLPDISCADRVAAGVVVWPLSEGPTSVLVVSFYGYSGDAPRTSLAFESLMTAVAVFGGPYAILGDFNITQTEGSLAAMLATGAIRAADDTGGFLHPNTNPTDTRRIDFAVAHHNLVASHVHTFRLPAVSDHGIVRVDFPTTCFPRSWQRPVFSPAPAHADAPTEAPADPGPEFSVHLDAGHLDEAWTYLSDWAEGFLGITNSSCPRSAAWLPTPRHTPSGIPGKEGHEPAPLCALRRLARRLNQLEQQPWDSRLCSCIARSLHRVRALAPELPHLDLDNPGEARAHINDLVDARQKQHRLVCLQRWREKTALSPDAALAWVKKRADLELRTLSPSPLQEVPRAQIHPAQRVQIQGEEWTCKWQTPTTTPDCDRFAHLLGDIPSYPTCHLDLEPSPTELRKAAKQMRRRAPGPDGWTGDLLLRLPDSFWTSLAALWAKVIRTATVPALWQRSIICLLDKGHSATRPIALLPLVWRVGARVIARKLKGWICQWCDHRALGSAPGRSPIDMHRRLMCAWSSGVRSFLQQDISAFFDSLSVPVLQLALTHLGAPPTLGPLVEAFYGRQLRLFTVDSFTTARWHRAHHGVLQGCPLSPLLSLTIGFLWSQHVARPGVEAGIYVDDRMLWLTGQDQSPEAAQAALRRSDQFDRAVGLTCSCKKCHLVTTRSACPWRSEAEARGYEIGSAVKFLGVEVDLASGDAVPLKLNLRKLQVRLRHTTNPAFSFETRRLVIRSLVFPALFWAAGVAMPSPAALEATRQSIAAVLRASLSHEAPRVLVGQVLGWTLDVSWVADWSAISALVRALVQQPEWHEHLSLQELSFLRTSSLPGAKDVLQKLGWRLDPQGRAITRVDDTGCLRTYRFGEDSPEVLKSWLTEAHKAEATSRCGRVQKKLHRHDPSLAVGLDLPRPEGDRRFAFHGHRQVYLKANTPAERYAALACGGTGWHFTAKHSLSGPVKCLCAKLWPSRAHLLWSCPDFAAERSGIPVPVDRAEERLLGRPVLEYPPPPDTGVCALRPQVLHLLEQAADTGQQDLLIATDGSSEQGVGAFAAACLSPRLDMAGADAGEDQSPFRMELLGILGVLEALAETNHPPRRVTLLVDCEAAIKSICCPAGCGHYGLASKAQLAGAKARQRGIAWTFVWTPSHGKKPRWSPLPPLQAGICRMLNQAADAFANQLRRTRLRDSRRATWHNALAQASALEQQAVRLSAFTSKTLEASLCTEQPGSAPG